MAVADLKRTAPGRAEPPAPPKHPRRRIRKLRLVAVLLLLFLLSMTSFTFGLLTALARQIPALDPARQQHIESDGYVYDSTGKRVLTVLRGSQSRVLVDSNQISSYMKHAIVAIEDRRFYEHRGIDLHGMGRALWADISHQGYVQGGSTITQQFVKNAYVKNERSITRKLKEAALAWQLEQQWSKDRILTAYLNTIYFGNGAYGVEQAAQTYFHHSAKKLSLPESALLAGIPQDPSRYDPVANPIAARARRQVVLKAMLDQRDISLYDYTTALRAPLPKAQAVRLPGTQGPAQYFVNYVKQQLVQHYGSGRVFGGGLRIRTTIDLGLQQKARDAISKWLTDPEGPSAALVSIDPRDGSVLAMVGGNNYQRSQFNLAVQGERQPGSSFKPFVLAAALGQGISPQTTFKSGTITIYAGGTFWSVHNYEGEDLGTIDLTSATIHSDNTVYAQLTRVVGPRNIVQTAHRLGIKSHLRNWFAIGLGAQAVNPLEMARAFAVFANGGKRIDGSILGDQPRVVDWVARKGGGAKQNRPVARQVMDPNDAAIETSILEGVVREGTGHRAALPDRVAAGKTGTTENYGDAWFVGYTPELVTAVWVGYPTRLRPMLTEFGGQPVAGGTYPAEIWKTFTESALKQPRFRLAEPFPSPSIPYASPKRVVWRNGRLMLDNGRCKFVSTVWYFSDRGPTQEANCKPNEVDVPRVVGQTLANAEARLRAQPLTPVVIYKPATPLQRTDIVIAQYPAGGTLSTYEKVTLVKAKALHGTVPRVVGLPVTAAKAKLARLRLDVDVKGPDDGRVVSQQPPAGVAAAPGARIKLVARGG